MTDKLSEVRKALEERIQNVMVEVFEYGLLSDGINDATGKEREIQIKSMKAQDKKIRGMLALLAHPSSDQQEGSKLDEFKTVVRSSGYIHDANKHGSHGSATFKGVECPNCKHVFMPILGGTIKCPECGYTSTHHQIPSNHPDPLQALSDQAQELDMGYGKSSEEIRNAALKEAAKICEQKKVNAPSYFEINEYLDECVADILSMQSNPVDAKGAEK